MVPPLIVKGVAKPITTSQKKYLYDIGDGCVDLAHSMGSVLDINAACKQTIHCMMSDSLPVSLVLLLEEFPAHMRPTSA